MKATLLMSAEKYVFNDCFLMKLSDLSGNPKLKMDSCSIPQATSNSYIPRFVLLYTEIIHEFKRVDYLLVQADKPWYNIN